MLEAVLLDRALCLPPADIAALLEGQLIAAIPRVSVQKGWQFALYPFVTSDNVLVVEQQYRSQILPLAKAAIAQHQSSTVSIAAWAKCERSIMVHDVEQLEVLSQRTIWTKEALRKTLEQRQHLFLALLRVYRFSSSITVPKDVIPPEKFGKFIGLASLAEQFHNPLKVTQVLPVLNDRIFAQRKHQLENLEPPEHPELEELHRAIALLAITNPDVKAFVNEIESFLGWADNTITHQPDSSLDWISEIATLGNRSKEQDEGKSNYQAGTEFENVVRDSLEFLGFKVDYSHKGGAGGLDLFCSAPYPLVGECKAGKKIPNDTAVQLLNLGTLRLQSETLLKQAAKLIIGPGEPTNQLEDAAKVHHMAIINPETLEKLVKLQNQYRGSVDLVKLKDYLKPGRADDEVEKYIDLINQEIKLRSHIIQSVKEICESDDEPTSTEVKTHYNARFAKNASSWLNTNTVRDLLVELSSPLTGYLGRKKGSDGNDRFYFLRDLHI
jgi:hypothetical protein